LKVYDKPNPISAGIHSLRPRMNLKKRIESLWQAKWFLPGCRTWESQKENWKVRKIDLDNLQISWDRNLKKRIESELRGGRLPLVEQHKNLKKRIESFMGCIV